MRTLYHILGSDIPHHNQTVLNFFQTDILPQAMGQDHRFYVVGKPELRAQYPQLALQLSADKKSLAREVVAQAKRDPHGYFVLHGQFNPTLWLAILSGKLPAKQCVWHVWGADLYEDSTLWKFKLFYPLRRLAQAKLPKIWATKGDLHYVHQRLKRDSRQDRTIYFPTKMNPALQAPQATSADTLTILLGNSGDHSNRHLAALEQIYHAFGEKVRVIVPMGYPENNGDYIAQVQQQAARLFPQGNVEILTEKIAFERYLAILGECQLGYFIFERQQGIGTICLLTQFNIPIVLHCANPFHLDMQAAGIPFLYADALDAASVAQARQVIVQLDKRQIPFFYPNYTQQWLNLLTELATE